MSWDYVELSPCSKVGPRIAAVESTGEATQSLALLTRGSATQADAAQQSISDGTVVSTDPPYFDNIGFADLDDDAGLLVRPEAVRAQRDAEVETPIATDPAVDAPSRPPAVGSVPKPPVVAPAKVCKRYYGSVVLDSTRVGRDAGKIAEEVISHLAGIVGAKVKVTMEIEATFDGGVSESTMRIVSENGRTLKFTSHGFEEK